MSRTDDDDRTRRAINTTARDHAAFIRSNGGTISYAEARERARSAHERGEQSRANNNR